MNNLTYTIIVMGPVFGTQNSTTAFLFCRQLLKINNMNIISVFFYGNGVSNGNKMVYPISSNVNLVNQWYNLSQKFSINLYICSNDAQNRGIISDDIANEIKLLLGNLHHGFNITGLGILMKCIFMSDRLLQF